MILLFTNDVIGQSEQLCPCCGSLTYKEDGNTYCKGDDYECGYYTTRA